MKRRAWELRERRFHRCPMGDSVCENAHRLGQSANFCVDCRLDAGTLPVVQPPRFVVEAC